MMTRNDLMNALAARMSALPEAERARLMDCFAEMIDDRVAMGMPEADAVAALGDPEALLRDTCPEVLEASGALEAAPGDQSYAAPIREIHMHLMNADGAVRRGALPDGVTAQINASERQRFTWRLEDGVLTVAEAGETRRALFRRSAELTLILPELNPEVLIADSYGGDIEVEGIAPTVRAVLASSSGDIALRRFGCGGRLEVTTRSGDIEFSDIDAHGDCKLENLSGDIALKGVTAASLRARASSGDIEGSAIRAGTIAMGTASGDIELKRAEAEASLLCEAGSGDIDIRRASAPDVRLSTASGDIEARFSQRPEGVAVGAASRSGDVRVTGDAPNGGARIRAESGSGDIAIVVE